MDGGHGSGLQTISEVSTAGKGSLRSLEGEGAFKPSSSRPSSLPGQGATGITAVQPSSGVSFLGVAYWIETVGADIPSDASFPFGRVAVSHVRKVAYSDEVKW